MAMAVGRAVRELGRALQGIQGDSRERLVDLAGRNHDDAASSRKRGRDHLPSRCHSGKQGDPNLAPCQRPTMAQSQRDPPRAPGDPEAASRMAGRKGEHHPRGPAQRARRCGGASCSTGAARTMRGTATCSGSGGCTIATMDSEMPLEQTAEAPQRPWKVTGGATLPNDRLRLRLQDSRIPTTETGKEALTDSACSGG